MLFRNKNNRRNCERGRRQNLENECTLEGFTKKVTVDILVTCSVTTASWPRKKKTKAFGPLYLIFLRLFRVSLASNSRTLRRGTMSANQFRSTLMQQFANAAKNQSRPPLALVGWLSDEDKVKKTSSYHSTSQISEIQSVSSLSTTTTTTTTPRRPSARSLHAPGFPAPQLLPPPRLISSLQSSSSNIEEDNLLQLEETQSHSPSSIELQKLIQTRRTCSYFLKQKQSVQKDLDDDPNYYWRDVLLRAAECGYTAPNHKRTEPFTFKSIVVPSKIDELANVAYQVELRKQRNKEPSFALEKAEKKKQKWKSIPAYLVALVEAQQAQVPETISDDYEEIPFVAPASERELEDYASACAAVQNVLLSVHAEDLGTKWATGPVVKTKAFRQLIEADEKERVVGLLMIGEIDENKPQRERRHRRPLQGDVFVEMS